MQLRLADRSSEPYSPDLGRPLGKLLPSGAPFQGAAQTAEGYLSHLPIWVIRHGNFVNTPDEISSLLGSLEQSQVACCGVASSLLDTDPIEIRQSEDRGTIEETSGDLGDAYHRPPVSRENRHT